MINKPMNDRRHPGMQLGLMGMNASLANAHGGRTPFFQPQYFPPVVM